MLHPVADNVSRLRQRLLAVAKQLEQEFRALVAERPGLIRGTLGTRARVCGNPGCHCSIGHRHESKYLAATVGGRTRQVHVPASDEVKVVAGVTRYQRWRRTRSQIADCYAEALTLVDALGSALLAAYPADNPIPPAARRGRKPKRDGGDER
jgi:hypothetical protein